MSAIKAQAKSDGLRLLRAIDSTQAHGHGGGKDRPEQGGPPTMPGWRRATSARIDTTAPWVTFVGRARWGGRAHGYQGGRRANTTATRRTSSPGRV